MKSASENEYPKMVLLNYSTFNIEFTEQEQKSLKIFFLRTLQKIKNKVVVPKNSKFLLRSI